MDKLGEPEISPSSIEEKGVKLGPYKFSSNDCIYIGEWLNGLRHGFGE
jgi:hypothetical protein